MTADGDGCQRVVNAEPARHIDLGVKIHRPAGRRPVLAAGYMESHAQLPVHIRELQVRGADVAAFVQAVGFQAAGVTFRHLLPVGVIPVHNAHPALFKQKSLTVQIVLKAGMLVGADVIRLDVCKNAEVEHKALASMLHQRLGGYLHHHRVAALLHHPRKIGLEHIGFRRGVLRMDMGVPDDHLDGAHQSHLQPRVFQNGLHQISGGGFSLCPGDADGFQLRSRMVEPGRRQKGQRVARAFHLQNQNFAILRHLHRLLYHQNGRSLRNRLCRRRMSVKICPFDADEKAVLRNFSGIVNQSRNLLIQSGFQTAPQGCHFQILKQSSQFGHTSSFPRPNGRFLIREKNCVSNSSRETAKPIPAPHFSRPDGRFKSI